LSEVFFLRKIVDEITTDSELAESPVVVPPRGGVCNASGSMTLSHSAVTQNRAGSGGCIFKESGTVTLNDTVVKRNRPNNCASLGSVPSCTG
jgi:hypothetical protein